MKKKKKVIIVIILIMLIMGGVILGLLYFKNDKEEVVVNNVEVVDSITSYGYNLEDRDTEIYKEKYEELKTLLNEEEIDYEEYAKLVTSLFLIDLYTIDNKISKYDVGGLEFIYEGEQDKFRNKAMDTMYKLVEDNSASTRDQALPVVSDVSIDSIKETTYEMNEEDMEGYLVSATISYEKKLGYDSDVSVTLVKDNDKLYVVNLTVND